MFERYTEKARRVIFFARYEASQFGSPYIESEHLLLGIIREDKALTNRFLRSGVASIRKQVESQTTAREKTSTSVDLPVSNESKRVLAYAGEEAERLATSSRMALSLLRTTGRTIPVPTVETATRFLEEPAGTLPIARRRRMTLGTKAVVRDGLEAIAREYDAEELMIVTITHSHEARKHSYKLIAEAFGIRAAV